MLNRVGVRVPPIALEVEQQPGANLVVADRQELDMNAAPSTMERMNAAEKIALTLSEPLTWAEICERHPDEWVCLVEIERETPNGVAIKSARIVGHGKTRKEPLDQARSWSDRYQILGHYFTGRIVARPLRPQVVLDDETRDLFRYRP